MNIGEEQKTRAFHYVSIELIQSVYDKNNFLPRHENAGDQDLSQTRANLVAGRASRMY
jgi:hypothetical protein